MKVDHTFMRLYQMNAMLLGLFFSLSAIHAQTNTSAIEKETILIEALKEELIGNIPKSIDLLEKLKYEPEFKSVSYYLLSRMYFTQGKKEEALNAIHQSTAAEPDNKWYLLLNRNIAENLALAEEAALCNESLIRLEPNTYTYYDDAAYHYLQAGLDLKAIAVLDKAELVFGLTPEIAIKKAYTLGEIKKYKKALEVLERCLERYPNHPEIIGNLHTISQKSNEPKLIAYIESKYGRHQNSSQPIKSTETELLDVLFSNPDADLDTKIKSLLNHLQTIDQKDTASIRSLQKYAAQLLSSYPAHSKSHCLAADLYFLQNDYLLAKEHYIKATELGIVPYIVWDNLLFTLTELAHWNACVQFANRCIEYYPNQINPYYSLALGYIKLKAYDKALAQISTLELMQKHKKIVPAQLLVMKAKIADALQSDGHKFWEQALLSDTTGTILLEKYINDCTYNAQNFTLTEDKLVQLPNTSKQTNLLLAELYSCRKDYALAKKYLESAIHQNAFINTDLHALAAHIYHQLGLPEQSKQHMQLADMLSENPKKQ